MAAHAEGLLTHAKGSFSHAEGSNSKATGHSSHSEGSETTAGGAYSHAEGKQTIALGEAAHAEGTATIANGSSSHAEGHHTSTAHFAGSHIMGRFGTAEEAYSWFIANGVSDTDHNIGAKWLAHNGECTLRVRLTMQVERILHKCLKPKIINLLMSVISLHLVAKKNSDSYFTRLVHFRNI